MVYYGVTPQYYSGTVFERTAYSADRYFSTVMQGFFLFISVPSDWDHTCMMKRKNVNRL